MPLLLLLLFLLCSCSSPPAQKTVCIMTYKVPGEKPWDPSSLERGISGSEEAVIYMSEELAQLGYKVTVLGHPASDSPATANPRFIDIDHDDGSKYDIAISWRKPTNAKQLKTRASKVYFWPHDPCNKRLTDKQIERIDGILWLSKWQRDQWISLNPSMAKFATIFGNGIRPSSEKPSITNPYSCIYSSNYGRGLEILLDIWPEVKKEYPKATLDLYYGWKHWGHLTPEKEAHMRAQVAQLANLGVRDHGMVSHRELESAHAHTSLWTYPCIAPETFCITALRAQAAGNIPVILDGSALTETVRHGFRCDSREEYLATLLAALKHAENTTQQERENIGAFVQSEFTWKAVALKWKELFEAQP
ncbi:MAG: glycosyltransferase family 4 protein [Verrucomicrobia bacterium]|nr:glycosyltransferase family 4 protein [Verrucomicrobiota bacterium]